MRRVFVLGTGRCGSTLVHEVLARHEGTGFITNLDDLGVAKSSHTQNSLWRRLPPGATEKGRARFAPSESYRVLEREVGPIIVDPIRDLTAADATPWLAKRVRHFFDERSPRLKAPVLLHKFTGWPRVGFLDAIYPDALFIDVVRDGRAVANSWLQMPWWRGHRGPGEWHFGPLPTDLQQIWEQHDRSFPVLAALAWRMLIDSYEEARASVKPDRWLAVRYEDVVNDPRGQLGGMLEHMGLDWTSDFERGFRQYSFSSGRTGAYRRDLSAADVAAMEDVLGHHLQRLGYQ